MDTFAFEGAVNFRDLGGHTTADGRGVKTRKLFRCGHLAKLSANDQALLETLDLGLICDFRSDREAEKLVSKVPPSLQAQGLRLNIWPKSSRRVGELLRDLANGVLSDDDICRSQGVIYEEFVTDHASEYALLFQRMVQASGRGVLIHCTAGKDRTGIGATLILSALGVPQDAIMADYLISNSCPRLRAELLEIARRYHAVTAADEARFLRILGVREDALRASIDAMVRVSGSVDNYIRDALKVSAADRERLRSWYLD